MLPWGRWWRDAARGWGADKRTGPSVPVGRVGFGVSAAVTFGVRRPLSGQ